MRRASPEPPARPVRAEGAGASSRRAAGRQCSRAPPQGHPPRPKAGEPSLRRQSAGQPAKGSMTSRSTPGVRHVQHGAQLGDRRGRARPAVRITVQTARDGRLLAGTGERVPAIEQQRRRTGHPRPLRLLLRRDHLPVDFGGRVVGQHLSQPVFQDRRARAVATCKISSFTTDLLVCGGRRGLAAFRDDPRPGSQGNRRRVLVLRPRNRRRRPRPPGQPSRSRHLHQLRSLPRPPGQGLPGHGSAPTAAGYRRVDPCQGHGPGLAPASCVRTSAAMDQPAPALVTAAPRHLPQGSGGLDRVDALHGTGLQPFGFRCVRGWAGIDGEGEPGRVVSRPRRRQMD